MSTSNVSPLPVFGRCCALGAAVVFFGALTSGCATSSANGIRKSSGTQTSARLQNSKATRLASATKQKKVKTDSQLETKVALKLGKRLPRIPFSAVSHVRDLAVRNEIRNQLTDLKALSDAREELHKTYLSSPLLGPVTVARLEEVLIAGFRASESERSFAISNLINARSVTPGFKSALADRQQDTRSGQARRGEPRSGVNSEFKVVEEIKQTHPEKKSQASQHPLMAVLQSKKPVAGKTAAEPLDAHADVVESATPEVADLPFSTASVNVGGADAPAGLPAVPFAGENAQLQLGVNSHIAGRDADSLPFADSQASGSPARKANVAGAMRGLASVGEPGLGLSGIPDAPSAILKKLNSLENTNMEFSNASETPLIFDIPVTYNARVSFWIHYFQTDGRSSFRSWLERSARYLPILQYELTQAGLPQDLVYVAMIESGFSPGASSHASAMGIWQFIEPTGRRYGLKVDWWIDERKDFLKSTHAAIGYMTDLYHQFNSWYLVAASYNMGENGVRRLIQKHRTNNFWELADKRVLPVETTNYVPKIIAATLISKAPALYGFRDLDFQMPMAFEYFNAPGGTDLNNLAGYLGVSEKYLKELNPELIRGFVPRSIGSHKIRIPKGSMMTVSQFVRTQAMGDRSE